MNNDKYRSSVYCKENHSYPTEEIQLKMRLEDLILRLIEVENGEYGRLAEKFMDCRYQKEYLDVAPVEYLFSEDDIVYALAKAVKQLAVLLSEEEKKPMQKVMEVASCNYSSPDQLCIWDYIGYELLEKGEDLAA